MIFKTITSDIDKTRQSLLLFNKDWNTWKTNWNAATGIRQKIGSLFASTTISQSDVQAIQAYNAQIDACVTSQTAFNRTMLNASPAAQNLVASCNGAKVSMQQLERATQQVTLATKASHAAMKVFSVALNMIAYTAIIKGIQILSEYLYDLANAQKVASKNADELYNESSSKIQKNEEEAKSLEELIQRYKELKENEHLDLDGRQEVKGIQNDIADLVGVQAKNLDLVNGKLDEEIKKLDEISKKEAKQAFQDAEVNYHNAKDSASKAIGDDKVFFSDYDYAGNIEVDARKALEEAGFGVYNSNGRLTAPSWGGFGQDGVMGSQMVVKAIGDTAQEKYDYLQSMIEVLEQYGQRDSEIAIGLKEQAGKYEDYITNQQNAANSLVDSWMTYSQFSNEELSKINVDSVESFDTYRQKMIEEAKNDESIGKILADGTLSDEDLEKAVNDFMATSLNFSKWYEQWLGNVQGSTSEHETDILSISETIDQLNTQLKPAFDSLKSAYQDIFTDDGFTLENVDLSMLDSIKSALDEMASEEIGLKVDYSSFEELANILSDTTSTPQQVQAAFDSLATSILNSTTVIDEMDDSTAQLISSMLESLGVANSQELVFGALEVRMEAVALQEQLVAAEAEAMANGTEFSVIAFLNQAGASEVAKNALFALVAAEQVFNNTDLDTAGKVAKLKEIATAYGKTAVAAKIAFLEQRVSWGESVDFNAELANIQSEINNAINSVSVDFDGIGKNGSSAKSAGKNAADTYLEAFEKELKELDDLRDRGKITEKQYLDALRVEINALYRSNTI